MVKLKSDNVNLNDVHPNVFYLISVAAKIYDNYGVDLIITSARDSKHSKHSTHYKGYAVDIRVWNLPKSVDVKEIADEIQEKLGDKYYVLFEVNHIHIQWTRDNVVGG